MARSLKSLGDLEAAVMAQVDQFTGSIEEKAAQLEKSGVSQRYGEISPIIKDLFY